jgi:hypothetical protein
MMASRLYGSGSRLMEYAGCASGTSIRIETPPAIPVSTTSSLVTERSPRAVCHLGTAHPGRPWGVAREAVPLPFPRDDGVPPPHGVGRPLLCGGRHRLRRRYRRLGSEGPAGPGGRLALCTAWGSVATLARRPPVLRSLWRVPPTWAYCQAEERGAFCGVPLQPLISALSL